MPRPHTLSRRVCLAGSAVALVQASSLALGAALSGCDDTTGGRRIQLEARVTSDAAESHMTALGWRVELDEAFLCLASIVYLEGAPVASLLSRALVPSAHAHPGHYDAGAVIGESNVVALVDLLAGETVLGVEGGVTGLAQSAAILFHDPAKEPLDAPGGAVAYLHGVANRDAVELEFIAAAPVGEVLSLTNGLPEVDGCPLDGGDIQSNGVVTLTVRTALWLDQIDFSLVPAGEVELAAGEPPHVAFVRGVKKAAAYQFAYQPQ
jgi:hypothetical protein